MKDSLQNCFFFFVYLFFYTVGCIGLINVPRCTYLYTAPSGTFVMDFPLDSFADPQGLAVHVKIVATCPNTRIALTCPSIQQGVIISTVSVFVIFVLRLNKFCFSLFSYLIQCSFTKVYPS